MLNKAKEVMKTLLDNGYEAYIVGGYVRDSILGLEPKDIDLATNAHPDIVELLFDNTIPTGKRYGTITVMIENEPFEVTTYRRDVEYRDGRRPDVVEFAETLKEDLSRRDFTMNAMAMDIDGNIVDYHNGKKHLEWKELHSVGDATERFNEDKLRVLRMFRFCAKYNLIPYRRLYYAIQWEDEVDFEDVTINISNLSMERIRDEFNKILVCENPSKTVREMFALGILQQFIPEISLCHRFDQRNKNHNKDVFNHIMTVLDNVEPKLELRLAALFHDIGKPETFTVDENGQGHFYSHHKASSRLCREIMTRLKYSNKEIEYVSELVYWHMSRYENMRTSSAKKFINKVGAEKLEDLFKLQVADISASKPPFNFENVYRWKFKCEEVLNSEEPMSIKDLAVNGFDMMDIGLKGKEVGVLLRHLFEIVLEDPDANTKDNLIREAKHFIEIYKYV